jgi:hypothetical protein
VAAAAQIEQLEAPDAVPKKPRGHGEHADEPADANQPMLHADAPPMDAVPAAQEDPAGHG